MYPHDLPGGGVHQGKSYDALLETFGESINKRSCSTCEHFSMKYLGLPKCLAGDAEKNLYDKDLGTRGQCTNRYATSPKWKLSRFLDFEEFLDKHSKLNDFLEGDLYEVYEHFTGNFIEVPSGWFSTKRVRESFFYILKNNKGYFCYSSHSVKKGFLPLDDFTTMIGRGLVTYSEMSAAIEQCETFSSWGNKKGCLVYSTGDSLESRFRQLEGKGG